MPDSRKSIFGMLGLSLRAGALCAGRAEAARNRRRLLCLVLTEDLSDNSRREILRDFENVPILQAQCASDDIHRHTGLRNARVLGVLRSRIGRDLKKRLDAAEWVHPLHIPENPHHPPALRSTRQSRSPARKRHRTGQEKHRHGPDPLPR